MRRELRMKRKLFAAETCPLCFNTPYDPIQRWWADEYWNLCRPCWTRNNMANLTEAFRLLALTATCRKLGRLFVMDMCQLRGRPLQFLTIYGRPKIQFPLRFDLPDHLAQEGESWLPAFVARSEMYRNASWSTYYETDESSRTHRVCRVFVEHRDTMRLLSFLHGRGAVLTEAPAGFWGFWEAGAAEGEGDLG